jgi:hypothetical protein
MFLPHNQGVTPRRPWCTRQIMSMMLFMGEGAGLLAKSAIAEMAASASNPTPLTQHQAVGTLQMEWLAVG